MMVSTERTATMNATEWPLGAWAVDIGDYDIHCVVQEKPYGTFTIVVEENGVELRRETITGTGSGAWEWTEQLRQSYDAHIRQKMRDEWHRQGRTW
jgi:hypothetical protein